MGAEAAAPDPRIRVCVECCEPLYKSGSQALVEVIKGAAKNGTLLGADDVFEVERSFLRRRVVGVAGRGLKRASGSTKVRRGALRARYLGLGPAHAGRVSVYPEFSARRVPVPSSPTTLSTMAGASIWYCSRRKAWLPTIDEKPARRPIR